MSDELISILIPMKNGEKYLHECLDSILSQSIGTWEVVIVDDHSTDASIDIVEEYLQKDKRFRLVENKGIGVAAAMETGFAVSKGEFITRMDCDDVMVDEKLEKLKDRLIESGNNTVVMTLVSYFSDDILGEGYKYYEAWLNRVMTEGKVYEEIYRECTIPSPSWMVYKDDCEKYQLLLDLDTPEDYDLCFRFYKNNFKTVLVKEKLHLWRDHSDRTSRKDKLYDIRTFGLFKLKRFLELDFRPNDSLVLWGSGKKGKKLANYLTSNSIDFKWVTDNKNKADRQIHKVDIKSPEIISRLKQPKVIIAVSNKKDQKNIVSFLEKEEVKNKLNYFLFF